MDKGKDKYKGRCSNMGMAEYKKFIFVRAITARVEAEQREILAGIQ